MFGRHQLYQHSAAIIAADSVAPCPQDIVHNKIIKPAKARIAGPAAQVQQCGPPLSDPLSDLCGTSSPVVSQDHPHMPRLKHQIARPGITYISLL